jgi:hypothetical protein
MSQSSWRFVSSLGWMPSSAGGIAKMSQPAPASTAGQPSTSRKKARTRSASRA